MKSKLSWIAFVPLTVVAGFFKLARYIAPQGSVFGLSDLQMDYAFIYAVVLIFLFTALFCFLDKKISTYYLPHRNFAAGIFGLLAALAFAVEGADSIYRMIASGNLEALSIIEAVLMLLSSVVFIVLGLTHSLRSNDGKRFVLFNIMPALLFAVRMISCFVGFTTISVRLADVPQLVCYIFAAMFFFNYAVTLSLTKTKNAVKSCFIFGFPAITSLLIYGFTKLIFEFDTQNVFNNIEAFEMFLIGAYILAFMIELTVFIPDKDSVAVIEEAEDEPDDTPEAGTSGGYMVKITDDGSRDEEDASSYLFTSDTEDFLYQETQVDEEVEAGNNSENDVEGYLTTATNENEDDGRPADYESRLDHIDKLILEITEKTD